MQTEIRTIEAPMSGLKMPVVEYGPRWVFDLWYRGTHRCSARSDQGVPCAHYVNLQAGVSRFCERHRPAAEPVYAVQSTVREDACPCGCGYGVHTHVMAATLLSGTPRRAQSTRPLWPLPDPASPLDDEAPLRRTS